MDEVAALPVEDQPLQRGLGSPSFLGLLFTQLLTAINDNIFRWLVIGIAKDAVDPSNYGNVLMAGTACFVLPYLVLAAPAGYLADRYSKRQVIIGCKIAEVVIMALGVVAITQGHLIFLFVVVGLMGAQSALFSPAKLGSIPEMLPASKISAANGLFGLMTVVATLIGMVVGNHLKDITGFMGQESWGISAAVLLGVAVVGWLISLLVARLPAANTTRHFPWDAPLQTWRDLRVLASNGPLFRVALGMVFFWSVGALGQLNIDQLAYEGGALKEADKVPLLVSLIVGVGLGSVLAGVLSQGRVELGILPLGAGGVALGGVLLFTVPGEIFTDGVTLTAGCIWASVLLFGLGLAAGMFDVPLEAFMQHRSPPDRRGSILAASNFLTFGGILISAVLFSLLRLPMYEGSLDQVAATARSSPDDNERAAQLAEQFRDRWRSETDPDARKRLVESLVEPLEEPQKSAALAHLLWDEFALRREEGETLNRDIESARFPDQQPVVRDVYREAIGLPLFSSRQIFLLVGVGTVPVFIYILWLIPQATIRFLVWLASITIYRIRVYGKENLPAEGGAVLAPNHISWLDGILLLLTTDRPVRVVVFAGNFTHPVMRWLADMWGAILLPTRPKELVRTLNEARQSLKDGELVCIFPEGGISRSGQVQAFRPGVMKILKGTDCPVIPVYLDELWGSIFSFDKGKFFWKWPRKWPYPISIYFGEPLDRPKDAHEIRQAVMNLGASAVKIRMQRKSQLTRTFVRKCKQQKRRVKIRDSSGGELTGGGILARSLVLRRILQREVYEPNESHVGLLLPPSLGGAIANVAVALDRKVSVNLNYTVSSDVLNSCIEQAGIKHVLTSRRFIEKLQERMTLDLNAELVMLEDFKEKATLTDKLVAGLYAYVLPAGMLESSLRLNEIKPDDVLTVIFTSGSTGTPKGVMLTQSNIASNVEAIDQVIRLTDQDTLLGVLPFFHSLGYTVTLWGVMALDLGCVYHFNPLDGKQIGKLCEKHKGTVLLATPTFLRTYLRRCTPEQMATLNVVVAGAEKLPPELSDAFEKKFGVRPVEGYGTTELSPLVSVNVPPSRSVGNFQTDCKEGTVGRPVPGVSAKVVDLDSGVELSTGDDGMLLISGPNVMKGYLGRDDLTAKVIKEGWYETGDVAHIDDEGFIKITGRISRFSKIGGEMVPHLKIEEALTVLIGADEEEGLKAAVTSVADAKKGERLVVVHTELAQTPEELRQGLRDAGLPNIFIPSADSFMQVEQLPVLGTGKLDLKGIRQAAEERFGS